MTCVKCGKPLPERSGPGRPQLYCSPGCRRSAEHEVRRAERALERTEVILRRHRTSVRRAAFLCCMGATDEHVGALDAERVRLEDRLRLLLAG